MKLQIVQIEIWIEELAKVGRGKTGFQYAESVGHIKIP
jgi:hypothetical protein